jgi:RNase H-like domain found in reverse transcriptase
VLYQEGRPIAYKSRRLTPAEVNYPTGEQERFAVVHALTVWRCYLEGAPEFRVVTDHKAITYLDNLPTLSRRQTRWAEFLSCFTFRCVDIIGNDQGVI